MRNYLNLLSEILGEGERREDRTGTGTYSLFGTSLRFNLRRFPLVTTKRVPFKWVIRELLWFISGSTNIQDLHPCTIWDEWADENGRLGPVYGKQWRDWGGYTHFEFGRLSGIDQLQGVVDSIKNNPTSRRHIVNAWNVSDLDKMALPPCHMMFQFYVRRGQFLDCQMYQRSADMFLGVPFNIASYAALTYMIAHICDLKPGTLNLVFGDAHIYSNHIAQAQQQIKRVPQIEPELKVHGPKTLDGWSLDDFELIGYDPHPPIKGDVSV